jgi:hypothetical protein
MERGQGAQAEATRLAPGQKLPRGAPVGIARLVVGELRREELQEPLCHNPDGPDRAGETNGPVTLRPALRDVSMRGVKPSVRPFPAAG